jgi:hypothetical protein
VDRPHSCEVMTRTTGLLVVNRIEMMRKTSRVLASRTPALPLAIDTIFHRCRGLDGNVWPELEHPSFQIEDGLADIPDWSHIRKYAHELPCHAECDIIALSMADVDFTLMQRPGWTAAGFDVGYLASEWSRYSVILNEVLFGMYDELKSFAARLNENLLLPTLEDGRELIVERARLFALGRDLEREPPAVIPITVYVPIHS